MKKFLIFIVVFSVSAYTASKYTEGVHGFIWGDTKQKIKAKYPKATIHENSLLAPNQKYLGLDSAFRFDFVDNKLFQNAVFFDLGMSGDKRYFSEFDRIEGLLESRYGTNEEKIREKENDIIDMAMSLKMDEAEYYDIWQTKESRIVLQISQGGYIFGLQLSLWKVCTELEAEYERQEEEKYKKEL